MVRRRDLAVAGVVWLLSPLMAGGQGTAGRAEARVVALADELWVRRMEDNLSSRLRNGLPVRRLPTLAYDEVRRDAEYAGRLLQRLDSARALPVGSDAWSLATVVRFRAEEAIAAERFFWFRNPVSPYANELDDVHRVFTGFRFATAGDENSYLDLLEQYPGVIDSYVAYLRGQARRGIVMPRDEAASALRQVRGFVQPAERSLFAVDTARLRVLDGARRSALTAQVVSAITERINPSLQRLVDYLEGPYMQQAGTRVGLSQYPGGEAFYRQLVGQYLTFDMTPEAVHQLGLREVARLNATMDSIRRQVGFSGSKAEFHRLLRTDARFVPKSTEDVRRRMVAAVDTLMPKLREVFHVVPNIPYDVRRLPAALEPGMTFGYFQGPTAAERVGVYFFNGSNLDQKSQVWYVGLAYHELMPGHHYQASLAVDRSAKLHPLRQAFSSTAFGEGWAEYAATLAGELGGYRDPYDRYGRLIMDLFASVRLVLDTGMNLMGWSREQAKDYMRENSIMSEPEIESETLRYCCDIPAQALGYRMGSLKIMELRQKAQAALGSRFDLRDFHQLVIGDGVLPFTALEQRIDQYIARGRRGR